MKTSLIAPLSIAAVLTAACGESQVTPDYEGESLLHMKGSIETSKGVDVSKDMVPAVLWFLGIYEGDFGRVRVQDVDVSGEFPNKFELDIYEPPPAEALKSPKWGPLPGLEHEPNVFFAQIGAVPQKHEDVVYLGYEMNPVEDECDDTFPSTKTMCKQTYCDYYHQCWSEWHDQTKPDFPIVKATGTAAVRHGLGVLAGFVDGYFLIYLDGPAKKGSLTAHSFGVEELAAGYHLVRPLADGPEPDFECTNAADDEAHARFQKAFGVSYTEVDDDDPRSNAVFEYEYQAEMEHGCIEPGERSFAGRVEMVDLDQLVTMKVGADLGTDDW